MKLTILDGNAVNPGDLDWRCLENLGELTVYPRTPQELVVSRSIESEALFTNKVFFTKEILRQLPKLRYIGVFATGYNQVDVEEAARLGIIVTNIPSYSTDSVAQLTFAHLMNLSFHLSRHCDSVGRGDWVRSPDFCYWNTPLVELCDLTFGVIGYGEIGRKVARLAEVFGMKVLAFSPSRKPGTGDGAVSFVDFQTLLKESDVVSLHCPLKAENRKMIDAGALSWMKTSAFFLNTARGGLVDEDALADALNCGQIAGAGLDVLSEEPPQATNPLLSAKNCYITPHLAWGTLAARKRLQQIAAENFSAFLRGERKNVVNGD